MGEYYVYESDRPTRRRRYRLFSARASRYPPPEEDYDYDGDYYYEESNRDSRRAPPPADYEYDRPRSRRESSRPRPRARTPARAADYRRRSSSSRDRDRERERDSDEYQSRSRCPAQKSYEYERKDEGVQSKRYYNAETGWWAGTDFFVDGKLVDRMDRSADEDLLEKLEKIRIKKHEEGEKRIAELKKEIEDLNNY
ncbi:hypothetical protein B0T24DRAFT_635157 [Lasiosphaeria ovina]|uniref:Uncharacterized protein n=1 Tax=Lasiosphaeria ovina TaxID=92902 RepID=A0AAE0N1F3_9PEZI|nr:hypothetical protein B0T24DRAFT_635157 [Lasiosphaeria ovina]